MNNHELLTGIFIGIVIGFVIAVLLYVIVRSFEYRPDQTGVPRNQHPPSPPDDIRNHPIIFEHYAEICLYFEGEFRTGIPVFFDERMIVPANDGEYMVNGKICIVKDGVICGQKVSRHYSYIDSELKSTPKCSGSEFKPDIKCSNQNPESESHVN